METTTQDLNDSSTGSGSTMFRRLGLWAAAGAVAVSAAFGVTLEAGADNRGGDVHAGPTRAEFTPIAPADAPRFTPIAPADAPRFTPIAPADAPRFTPIAPASSGDQHAYRGAAHNDGSTGKQQSGARGGRG